MRLLYHPDSNDISLAGVLYALGDPVRLEMVRVLAQTGGEQPCAALDTAIRDVFPAGVAKSTLSHHFKILRESGVVFCRKDGTSHLNSLRRDDLDRRFPGLLEVVLRPSTTGDVAQSVGT